MTLFQAILLSIIEGLTEFLPISSTGHLLLAQKLFAIPSSEFSKSFDIIIQFAAILAVVWIYRQKLSSSLQIWIQSTVAFLPTGIIGLLFYKVIRNFFFENTLVTVFSLLIGGFVLLLVDRLKKLQTTTQKTADLKTSNLFSIGLFQSISIIPGVSRSAASIIGGLFNGLSRSQAVEFSFFLAIPTMLAATGFDLLKSGLNFTSQEYSLLAVGCLFSFISSLLAVKFFLNFVKKNDFTIFALYRIVLAIVFLLFLR